MKTWLDKICSVLENPKYKNTSHDWVDINPLTNEIRSCCALGELFLRAKGKPKYATSNNILQALKNTYKVPWEYQNMLFHTINRSNVCGYTKRQIAKIIKREFK